MTVPRGSRLIAAAVLCLLMSTPFAAAGHLAVAARPAASPVHRAPSASSPISHVVVIYQENHTFDETLGAWCNTFTPARCDGFTGTVTLADGAVVAMQPSPDVVPQAGHGVADQVKAMDGGRMDGWDKVSQCQAKYNYQCLTYYSPAQSPSSIINLTTLANTFAVSDRTFSMGDSPSWGGHMYPVAASLDGFTGDIPVPAPGVTPGPGWGCDSKKISPWSASPGGTKTMEPSCVPDPALGLPNGGAFQPTPVPYIPTMMDRLDAAGLSWRIYASGSTSNSSFTICPSFAECLDTSQHAKVVASEAVLTNAKAGTLPNLSIVIPSPKGAIVSQHNGTSMMQGDNWIGQVVSALEAGPEWSSTAIFITYDDCGCFYDHVAPPLNPDGTREGPRIPMVIVSPWARQQQPGVGFTDSTPASFASILAFTEHTFGLTSLGVNDANAYDYSNSFNFAQTTMVPRARMVQSPVPPGEHTIAVSPDDPT